jgi:hypothetical protein
MPKPLLSDYELRVLLRGLFSLTPSTDIWRLLSGFYSTEIRFEKEFYALPPPKELQFEEFTVFFYAFHFWEEDRPTVSIQFSTRRRLIDFLYPQSIIRLRKLIKGIADDVIVGTEWTRDGVLSPGQSGKENDVWIDFLFEGRVRDDEGARIGPNSSLQVSSENHDGKNFVILTFDGRKYCLRNDGRVELAIY